MRSRSLLFLSLLIVVAGALAAGLLVRRHHDDAPTGVPATTPVLRFDLVADGLERPVQATSAGDSSGRLFVVEQRGRVRIVRDGRLLGRPFLDITSLVGSSGNEQGLLSIVFAPDYADSGLFFVDYTNVDGDTVVARYAVSAVDPDLADPASAVRVLFVDQPAANHNGGLLLFGPDGYLYVGLGDGGGGGGRNGQALDTLLGKILRLDVSRTSPAEPYSIPSGNPFASTPGARPEIWLTGLRNPWRFSFDARGDLYIGDVGSTTYEEVDVVPAGESGQNFGWNLFEGPECIASGGACATPSLSESLDLTPPVAWYEHDGGDCVVTGGYVYRGEAAPSLRGLYVFGDYCSGRIRVMARDSGGRWSVSEPLATDMRISSFGEDEAGELYVVDLRGGVYRVSDP